MKKTLVALTVAALAATSAQAVTVLDQDGSKVVFDGSLRLIGEKQSNQDTALKNAGTRFRVTTKHQIDQDFYALGRVEFRFDKNAGRDGFGDLNTKRAYVGLGSQQAGELTFGRQLTIADDLSQADDYEYGLINKGNYIATSGNSVIRYDYKGVEGLQVGANYNFGQGKTKNAAGLGVLYAQDSYDVRFGYGHTNYTAVGNAKAKTLDGYLLSTGYSFGDFALTGDFGYANEKDKAKDAKTDRFYVSPGFKYQVIPASKVYGNYLYEESKTDNKASTADTKAKRQGVLLGVDYKFHKQVVVFLEGAYTQTKEYTANVANGYKLDSKTNEKAVGVGMRVFW